MMKASNYRALLLVSLAGAAVSSQAFTVATFSDPSSGTPPLFSVTGSTISGGWSGTGLSLQLVPNSTTYTNVTFSMAPVTRVGSFGLGAGSVVFLDSSANPLLTINFSSGSIMTPFFFGASFTNLDNVTFTSPYINTANYIDEQFSFSFANQKGRNGDYTYTASFTSSAEAVPEPASIAVLGIGAAALIRRRFRKA
jgi:hypothetical protein